VTDTVTSTSTSTSTAPVTGGDSHHMANDFVSSRRKRVLIVVANPATNQHGWPVGFWAAELTHPWYELTERGVEVTIASPDGGRVEVDALSDPRDPSRWSAEDLVSMGFLCTPELAARLEDTPAVTDLDPADFDAVMIAGGQSPMFTYRGHEGLARTIRTFYEAEKPVAAYCHGLAALVDLQLSDGSALVAGRTVTGFSDVEEDYGNAAAGVQIMPWRLEPALRERGANYVSAGLFKAFAVRDGRLVTGQQQYSGRKVAQVLIEMLGV
jgi:putative intracellular protease/amidase